MGDELLSEIAARRAVLPTRRAQTPTFTDRALNRWVQAGGLRQRLQLIRLGLRQYRR